MDDVQVKVIFSNGDSLLLTKDSWVFPINLSEHDGEKFSAAGKPVRLEECFHHHHGLIPELVSVFSQCEFFTIDSDILYDEPVYKTSAIVSMTQRNSK